MPLSVCSQQSSQSDSAKGVVSSLHSWAKNPLIASYLSLTVSAQYWVANRFLYNMAWVPTVTSLSTTSSCFSFNTCQAHYCFRNFTPTTPSTWSPLPSISVWLTLSLPLGLYSNIIVSVSSSPVILSKLAIHHVYFPSPFLCLVIFFFVCVTI